MKVTYTTKKTGLTFEFDVKGDKETFEKLSSLTEVFEEDTCGQCGKSDLRFIHRQVAKDKKTYNYYELRCRNKDCRARLDFGCSLDEVSLFPKRKDKEGKWVGKGGWYIWSRETENKSEENSEKSEKTPF